MDPHPSLVIRGAVLDDEPVDVAIDGDVVVAIEPAGAIHGGGAVIDARGGALLPGLHDHHLHLLSMAAALGSVDAGDDLDAAIGAAQRDPDAQGWIRVVGYDEQAHGPLDRWRLDALAPGRAVRVQHRSGAMWVLNSVALGAVGAVGPVIPDGVERDERGEITGRLFRLDRWLRDRMPDDGSLDLAAVGRRLARSGVTGVTDCTATATSADFALLASAVRRGDLPVTVMTTGEVSLADTSPPDPLRRGPVKVVLSDHALPGLSDVVDAFGTAHRAGRTVAVHCVTRASLVLALSAWDEVGTRPGDRIEHASITPLELIPDIVRLGLAVVTQPGFIADRGDAYLRHVDPLDRPDLYRCASFLAAGVPLGGSTDAPFGPDDPWLAMRTAVDRATASGAVVGPEEAVSPEAALTMFLAPLDRPGGPPRSVTVGVAADLCLLDRPLAVALDDPSASYVRATISQGVITHHV